MAEEDGKGIAFAGDMLLVSKYAPEKSQEMAQASDDSVQRIRFAKIVISVETIGLLKAYIMCDAGSGSLAGISS